MPKPKIFGQKIQIASFLFLGEIEPYLGRQFFMTPSTKRCSLIFDLGPLAPKIYSPKFAKKSPISLADVPEIFAPNGVFGDGWFNGTMQNVVRPTLVAMATKFGLGAEIQSPTGLYEYLSVRTVVMWVQDRVQQQGNGEVQDDTSQV